jgi:hypothetical protein
MMDLSRSVTMLHRFSSGIIEKNRDVLKSSAADIN